MEADQIKALHHRYPVLSRIDPDLLAPVLTRSSLHVLPKGTRAFEEFQPCRAFPFILSGRIRVFKQSEAGRELSLYHVGPGDTCIVSTGCLLGDTDYNAAGLVKEDARLVMMGADDFNRLLEAPAFREFIFSLVSERIMELMRLVEEVAFQKLDRRLAALLLRQGDRLAVSHQELADELGTVREMVTRLLNSFSDSGLIRLGRGRIDILDEKALKSFLV